MALVTVDRDSLTITTGSSEPFTMALPDVLRQVWNARGAADREAIKTAAKEERWSL